MEESKNKNTQNRSSNLPEQLQPSQSNKKISNFDNKENSYSSPRNNISSPRSNHSSIKEENLQNNDSSKYHSPRSPKIDSLEEQPKDLQNNNSDVALPANYSESTNISDINIISDVSEEIIPKNKLLKMFREEHNNKIKKTKRILRDADYRHAQYNSHKKSRSSRSKTRSNPNLDSNKAIISSIPERIKQSPENNIGNNEKNEEEEIKERSVSIGSLGNQDNNKTNSLKSNENNSPKSPKSNKSFSSHASKFTNDKLSPGQLQGNNSLENIASYNNCSTHSEELSHQQKHHSKRKRKRPHLVLSPVQCNNFFSNSNTTPDNKIKVRSINGNNTNLSPSDGQNFQFTPPSKLNSNGSKAKNDNNIKNNKTKLETHFSSNLMHNSSNDFETVNAAPDELNSSSSFATVQAVDKSSSLLAVERGIGFPIKDQSLSEVSLNFNTESLNFSQSDDFHTDNNSKLTNSFPNESYSNLNNKHNNSNISNPKSKNSHVSIKNIDSNHSNSKIERNRSSSHKSNSIIERNIPRISDKELLDSYSNDESKLYTYTYETIGISDSKSWTYMSIYDYEYEEDEDNNRSNGSKNYSSNKESEKERSDKHQSYSSIKEREVEKGSEIERSDKNKSHLSNRESEKFQSYSSINEREVEKGSDKNSRHQSQLSAKESENGKSSKHQSRSSLKESDIERSRHSEKSQNSHHSSKESENSKKRNDRSFDSKGSSPRSKKHSSSSSEKSTPIKSASNSNKLNSEELLDVKEREINSFDMTPSPRLEEIKRGIQYELERSKKSPQKITSSEKVASTSGQFSPRQLNSSKLSNNNNSSSANNSEKKESDFHFESENGHQIFQQPLLNNGKRNLNVSVHSNSVVSQESFTEIFDKCHTDDQSSSIVQPNMYSNNISSQNSEQIHLSSEKAANISHLSESCDEEPNSIRNISQIPNDALKRVMPNPSKDLIISLSESENENENEDDYKNDKTEQSLSLASSENASKFLSSTSSSSASASPSKKREVKLVRKSSSKGKISHDIRSFSINDIEKIIKGEEEEEVIEAINNPSSTSSIKPRKIDFASNTASDSSYSSGQKAIQKRTQNQDQDQPQSPNLRNRQISPLNSHSPLKSKETKSSKKPIFPAFDLPSSSSASSQARSSHSFSSLGRMVLGDEEEESNSRSGRLDNHNTSDTSSLLNSPSISPFNTLRVTIVEVKTEVEISDVNVHMFIHSDPRNVAETDVSKVNSNRHVFRETFNVSLDGLKEKVDTENSMNSSELIDENIIDDLCVVVRHQREVVARATIPISSVTFKIGKKVDRWYKLVPNGQIRMIALAVNQENRTATATPSNSSIVSYGSKVNQNSNFEIVLDKSYKNPNLGDSNESFELNQGEICTNPNLGESPKKMKKNSKKNLNSKESGNNSNLENGSSNNEVDEIELDVDVDVVVGRESGNGKK